MSKYRPPHLRRRSRVKKSISTIEKTSSSQLHSTSRKLLQTPGIRLALILVLLLIIGGGVTAWLVTRHKHASGIKQPDGSFNAQTIGQETPESAEYGYSRKPLRLGILANFPDPTVLYDSTTSTWYAFATNNQAGILSEVSEVPVSSGNIQMATSPDAKTWTLQDSSQVLPFAGSWTQQEATTNGISPALVWAPDILLRPDGKFVLYYSVAAAGTGGMHCVGAAISSNITGPYAPLSEPLFCPKSIGGAIDPSVIIDDNQIYLVFKVDGNSMGHGGSCNNGNAPIVPTPIMLYRMKSDGVSIDLSFQPTQILDRTTEDGPLVEAPQLVKADATYYLFYSSGCTRDSTYAYKYASSQSIAGPYSRAKVPLLKTGSFGLAAPGSGTLRQVSDGKWLLVVHGRTDVIGAGNVRAMFTAAVRFSHGVARIVSK